MGILNLASSNSVWRGVDYYESNNVVSWEKSGEMSMDGVVSGSGGNQYEVHIDLDHPRRSTCTCPFAAGRRVVCKHMVALYFKTVPGAYDDFMEEVREAEEEEENQREMQIREIEQYVYSLSKAALQRELISALIELEVEDDEW